MNPHEIRQILPLLCAISLSHDLPGERVLREGEGEGGSGGGGNQPPAKTFTQDELNAIVQKRLAEVQKKFADYDQLKELANKAPELEKQIAELNEKLEMAGKSEQEKAKLLAEKIEKQKATELALAQKQAEEAKAEAARAIEALRETKIRYGITGALAEAKALSEMMPYAVDAFRRETKIEFDDEKGEITSVEFEGVPYADVKKAATAWLKVRPGFAAAPAGGGGTRIPNGAPGGRSFDQMSAIELAEVALTNPPQR